MHTHTFWEFVYVLAPFTHNINGARFIAKANTALIIKPHDSHSLTALEKRENPEFFTHLNIKITTDSLKKLLEPLNEDLYELLFNFPSVPQFDIATEKATAYKKLIKQLFIAGDENETYIATVLKFIIVDIIEMFFNQYSSKASGPLTQYPVQIENLINLMQNTQYVSYSINDLIKMIDYSYTQALRIFKRSTGQTIRCFFDDIKMRYASNLLTGTDIPIIAVSNAIGYDSPSNFIRAFKKKFGTTPNTHRKKSY